LFAGEVAGEVLGGDAGRAALPGVLAGEHLDPGPVGAGSRFRLVVPFLGARMSLTYQVIGFVPDREVLLHAANAVLQSPSAGSTASPAASTNSSPRGCSPRASRAATGPG
jgi:hypothetical protein